MTVAALPATITYAENGSTTVFAAPFRFTGGTIRVERLPAVGGTAVLVAGADYTATGGTTDAGGTVTLAVAGPAGERLRISRVTPRSQPMSYTTGDRFPAKSHEQALDRQMLISQELDASLADLAQRAVLLPAGETVPAIGLPAARQNTVFGFGALGEFMLSSYQVLASRIAPYLPAALKGDPGGTFMAVGLFLQLPNLIIPVGTDRIITSGWGNIAEGPAAYTYDSTVDAAYAAAHQSVAAITKNGRGFRLDAQQPLTIQMFGGRADGGYTSASIGPRTGTIGATDNALVLRAALEFVSAMLRRSGRRSVSARSRVA